MPGGIGIANLPADDALPVGVFADTFAPSRDCLFACERGECVTAYLGGRGCNAVTPNLRGDTMQE